MIPIVVNFLLTIARDDKRDRFVEGEVVTPIESHEKLSIQFEIDHYAGVTDDC